MKNSVFTILFFSFFVSTVAQSDEINISASFAQSIELRVIGNANINFTFSTLDQYQKGRTVASNTVGFEVASSINFEVQVAFTPLVSAEGNEIDIDNLTFHMGIEEGRKNQWGDRWNFALPTEVVQGGSNLSSGVYIYGFYTASISAQTIITPGPSGNAGGFDDNRFYIQPCLGWWNHIKRIGKSSLLDQNITPGTYTCTLTLTALPEAL